MPIRAIREFIRFEASSGIVLFTMAVLALILDNSPLHIAYESFFHHPLSLQIGAWNYPIVIENVINDGLMSIFFLLVGLEIKRELFEGELKGAQQAALPGIAALGGMIVPALFYLWFNHHDAVAIRGWAIPTATDIAFALGILSLLGSRVPLSLKVFLTALAIFDDLGAIGIIAVFYSEHISIFWMLMSGACILGLLLMNHFGIKKLMPFLIVGAILWLCVLKSGLHGTLSGVLLAFTIPLYDKNSLSQYSPLRTLEHRLHPWVAFIILPLFALANAGVSFEGVKFTELFTDAIPVGIAGGLFLGKQVGIFLFTWLAVKFKVARMPRGATWIGIYGTSLICGVGFTMSLFIGNLAFASVGTGEYAALVRLGVILGSFASGLAGYLLLRLFAHKSWAIEDSIDNY